LKGYKFSENTVTTNVGVLKPWNLTRGILVYHFVAMRCNGVDVENEGTNKQTNTFPCKEVVKERTAAENNLAWVPLF
jgi:hypothetical protein